MFRVSCLTTACLTVMADMRLASHPCGTDPQASCTTPGNIDNEHNRRHFVHEPGRDMLPFRSYEGGMTDSAPFELKNSIGASTILNSTPTVPAAGSTDILTRLPQKTLAASGPFASVAGPALIVTPGIPFTLPQRWNNPHSSELEVNVWIRTTIAPGVVVVPIKLPACSGEGHQNNVFSFVIPQDFLQLPTMIPGFTKCDIDTCTLQVYAHSVESRQYALGVPLKINGTFATNSATNDAKIKPAPVDVGTAVENLIRDICLPSNDPNANIKSAVPQFPRLISDEFTHAYMSANDPYSPYSGQQPTAISRNMQYSCLNRMITGNRGELGKSLLNSTQASMLKKAAIKEADLVKQLEAIVNSIIDGLLQNVLNPISGSTDGTIGLKTNRTSLVNTSNPLATPNTAQVSNQVIESCFRCSQVGSTTPDRLKTNTYVPSFNIPPNAKDASGKVLLTEALSFSGLINATTGNVLIYKTVYNLMAADYNTLAANGFYYMTAAIKPSMSTLVATLNNTVAGSFDPQFRKRNQAGGIDGGKYAATLAYAWYNKTMTPFAIPGTFAKPVTFTGSSLRRLLSDPTDPLDNYTAVCYSPDQDPNAVVPFLPATAQTANAANGANCTTTAMDPGGMSNDGTCDKAENVENGNCTAASREDGILQMFCGNGRLTTGMPCSSNDINDGGALTTAAVNMYPPLANQLNFASKAVPCSLVALLLAGLIAM